MPSPTLFPKMTFLTEPPLATSMIAVVLFWSPTVQSLNAVDPSCRAPLPS